MGNGGQRFICWDLDETTGSFRDYRRMGLTRGMEPLLEGLRAMGLRHVITTAALRQHAEFVLKNAGLLDLYDGIFDARDICDADYNKHYLPVAKRFGIPESDAPGRILCVGNLERDAPADLDLAFLHHPGGVESNAGVYLRIISRLMALSGSWAEAHAKLQAANTYQIPVRSFEGGQQFIDGIWVGVGRSLRNVSPGKPSDRIISVYSVPPGYRSDIEIIKIRGDAPVIQPELSLSQ